MFDSLQKNPKLVLALSSRSFQKVANRTTHSRTIWSPEPPLPSLTAGVEVGVVCMGRGKRNAALCRERETMLMPWKQTYQRGLRNQTVEGKEEHEKEPAMCCRERFLSWLIELKYDQESCVQPSGQTATWIS